MKKAIVIILILLLSLSAMAETIQKGDSGDAVIAIQRILSSLNYLSAEHVTGDYDSLTEIAVLAFQLDHGLNPSGIADPDTQSAITQSFREANTTGSSIKNDGAGSQSEPAPRSEPETMKVETNAEENQPLDTVEPSPTIEAPESTSTLVQYYEYDGVDAIVVSADVLYEYGQSYVGKTVVTAFAVKSKESNSLKATTDNNDTFSYSIVAEFADTGLIPVVNGQIAVVIGVVDEFSSISLLGVNKCVTLKNCKLIKDGITKNEIEASKVQQVQAAEQFTKAKEAADAQAVSDIKQAYCDQCISVDYDDVERYPDRYKGKTILITGIVEQVSEGWFNTVTMRVNEGGGKMWYVSYTKQENEARILEGDRLTFYGECDGVETYTTIIGSRVTIPAITAKYYS